MVPVKVGHGIGAVARSKAAKILGMGQATLWRKLKGEGNAERAK